MCATISPRLKRTHDAALAWFNAETVGLPNPSWRELLDLIDKEARRLNAKVSGRQSTRWSILARHILKECNANGMDPAEFVLAQMQSSTSGAQWLVDHGKPITTSLFTSARAMRRYEERARACIRYHRNKRLGNLFIPCHMFAIEYFLDENVSMAQADAKVRAMPGYQDWSRKNVEQYPQMRWLIHSKAVDVVICGPIRPGAPVLEPPPDNWTYEGERDRLHRLVEKCQPDEPDDEPKGIQDQLDAGWAKLTSAEKRESRTRELRRLTKP